MKLQILLKDTLGFSCFYRFSVEHLYPAMHAGGLSEGIYEGPRGASKHDAISIYY